MFELVKSIKKTAEETMNDTETLSVFKMLLGVIRLPVRWIIINILKLGADLRKSLGCHDTCSISNPQYAFCSSQIYDP